MNSTGKVAVGVVGTSWWADAMYMPALAKHPNAVITAVCGRDRVKAEGIAKTWDVPHVFTSYDEMLASGLIDAVLISTVNRTHYEMTMKALDAGLHVLCEKPLALTYAQAEAMTRKAEASGKKCLVPFTYRFMPGSRYLKQLLDEGYIGKPYHLNMRYYTGYARDGRYLWRFDLPESGAGVLGDIGSHFLYLAQWYYGEIESVMCMLGHHVARDPRPDGTEYPRGDDSATMMLQFKNGAQGVIMVTAVCYEDTPFGQTHHMEFHGADGTLYYYNDWDTVQQIRGARQGEGMPKELPIPDDIWGKARRDTVHNTYKDIFREHDFMARAWINAIVEDGPTEPTFAEGAYIQRVMAACQLSADEGRRVRIDEITA